MVNGVIFSVVMLAADGGSGGVEAGSQRSFPFFV
jgi:hypothetical protein